MADSNRQIFNEGRVVGLSAYESYVRKSITEGNTPMSEADWISQNLTSGKSLLLKVPAVPDAGSDIITTIHVSFPTGFTLFPESTVHADFFYGTGHVASTLSPDNNWISWVTSYGSSIANESSLISGSTVYPTDVNEGQEDYNVMLKLAQNYNKIIDGAVVFSGIWEQSTGTSDPPADLHPDLSKPIQLRLRIRGSIDEAHRPCILLSGFRDRTTLSGVSATDGSVNKVDWANGAFLGPKYVPWATKVVFSTPSILTNSNVTFAAVVLNNTFAIFDGRYSADDLWLPVQPRTSGSGSLTAQGQLSGPTQYDTLLTAANGAWAAYRLISGRTYRIQTVANALNYSCPSSAGGLTNITIADYILGTYNTDRESWQAQYNKFILQNHASPVLYSQIESNVGYVDLLVNNFDTRLGVTQVWVKED